MKRYILSLAFILGAGGAFAQTPPSAPAPASSAPAPVAPASPATGPAAPAAGKNFKDVRMACMAEAKDKGLKGPERHQAIVDCVSKANPKFGSRMACAQEAHAKSLEKEARKSFMKDCMKTKG